MAAFTAPPPAPPSRRAKASAVTPTPATPAARTTRRAVVAGVLAFGGLWASMRGRPAVAADAATTDAEWRRVLSSAEFRVLREAGTERPFSSALNGEGRRGVFKCRGCDNVLFSSTTKFDSGTGWPSFNAPVEGGIVLKQTARDVMLLQREVVCANCAGHLGHVFRDGPPPTRERFCINGVTLKFVPE